MIAWHRAVADDFVPTLIGLLSTYFGLVLGLLALWLWLVVRMIRRMTVRLNDSELLALRSVSVVLPLSIDAVDFGLDFFGAPLAWFIANQSALKPLRGASFFEGLLPGTQLIPSTTLGWWWANHVRKDGPWPAGGGPPAIAAAHTLAPAFAPDDLDDLDDLDNKDNLDATDTLSDGR